MEWERGRRDDSLSKGLLPAWPAKLPGGTPAPEPVGEDVTRGKGTGC